MGQIGLNPSEFYILTPSEFLYIWVAWSARQQAEYQHNWERERWGVWNLFCAELKLKHPKPMKVMYPFPWDDVNAMPPEMSREERIEKMQKVRANYERLKK